MASTITSPQQQGVDDLQDLRPPAEQEQPPIQPLTLLMMHGLTNLKSDRAAKDAAAKSVDTPSPEQIVRTYTDPATGHVTHDITTKGVVMGNAEQNVQDAYDLPQIDLAKQLAPYAKQFGHKDPTGADIPSRLDSVWQRFRLLRELGNDPISALVDAGVMKIRGSAADERLTKDVKTQRLTQAIEDYKLASPVVTEADKQIKAKQEAARTDRLLGKDNASIISQLPFYANDPSEDLEAGATAIGKTIGQLTDREKAGITNAAKISRTTFEKTRSTSANKLIANLKVEDAAGLSTPEAMKQFIESTSASVPGGMTPQEVNRLAARVSGLRREWNNLDAQKQAQIQVERQRNAILVRQQQFAEDAAKLNTPQAAQQAAEASLKDGNQFHLLPEKTPAQQAFKAQVASLIKQQTGGRLPQEIKPGSEDDKTLTVVSRARQDVDAIEGIYNRLTNAGVPVGGPALKIIGEAQIEGKPSSYLARQARKLVPGFANLTPQQQSDYVSDIATMYDRSVHLTGRDVRAVVGGRTPERLYEIFRGTTPGFQEPDVFHGLITGQRRELDSAERSIREKQWGGDPPGSTAASSQSDKVISLDDALKMIKGRKK